MNETTRTLRPGADIRSQFPIFSSDGGARPLAYLDTAASSQKPAVVIDRLSRYLASEHSNIHRGVYRLSASATEKFESARQAAARFLNAAEANEIVFTRGATESINLAAHGCEKMFERGDTILLTLIEHHSNIVPWQLLAERRGLSVVFADLHDDASLDLDDLRAKLERYRPRLLAITHVSNAFGTVMPIEEICALAHRYGTKVLVDAAQSAPHYPLDVRRLDADLLVFSGHKVYGPTGIGVLYGKAELLEQMQPFMGGGDMIEEVTTSGTTFAKPPQRFEAGTPPIAEAIALESALDFVEQVGRENLVAHEHALFEAAWEMLRKEGVTLYGPALNGGPQASIIAFTVPNVHPHDLGTVADDFNVQLRTGHHCAMPALNRLGLKATARVSFGMYSTLQDVEQLCEAIRYARKLFG